MNKMVLTLGAAAALALIGGAAGGIAWASSHDDGPSSHHGPMHGQMNGRMNGQMGNMMGNMAPMLHGGDATAAETGDIHALFANNAAIRRSVTNLANGIRTVTESDDPQLAETIKRHVGDMLTRVAQKRDPGLPIESPELRAIFENYDKIATDVEVTDTGVIVTQTSTDAATVALLQTHAGQVTAFVKDGMAAAHTAMMQNMGGQMHGQMNGQMNGQMGGQMRAQMMQRMRGMNGGGKSDAPEDHSNH